MAAPCTATKPTAAVAPDDPVPSAQPAVGDRWLFGLPRSTPALVHRRAQRTGAEIAARAEHRKTRREPRESAYKEYIASVIFLIDWEYYDDEPNQDDELHQLLLSIRKAWSDVALAGPSKIKAPSERLLDACIAFRVAVRERAQNDFRTPRTWASNAKAEIQVQLSLFTDAAQVALDDDESRRRFRG
ncbi:hypothetical protein GCM10020367_19710 [Streptomyces sannanensis]|uniref:Uncharacterized protein n=1 Tax=Streptomyces sannanensis TaxID=285536 RepID=A0ABP6S8Y2_9ACTN